MTEHQKDTTQLAAAMAAAAIAAADATRSVKELVQEMRRDEELLRWPRPEDIADRGAWYLRRRRSWVKRHVESLDMISETVGRRRLTIDVVLPRDPKASVTWRDGQRLYIMPLVTLRKTPATANVDFCDEDGRSLPLLNRADNVLITRRALEGTVFSVVNVPDNFRPYIRRYLDGLVVKPTTAFARSAYVANIVKLLQVLHGDGAMEDTSFMRLHQLLRDVSTNSLIWVGIVGSPGERRVIKFAYDITLSRWPVFPRRRPGWRTGVIELEEGVWESTRYFDRGDGNEQGGLRRAWNRVATTIGWAATDITLDSPYLRGAESYHLQFSPPPGAEARSLRLSAMLVDQAGTYCEPEVNDQDRERAHLYFANRGVKRDGVAEISVRVGRRGYLSYCTAVAVVIAAMLWTFAHYEARVVTQRDAAAATLLLVPALLGVFVLRPGEHNLVSRLLAGVRAIMFSCGLLSAAAAAALVGVRPFGISSVGEAWRWYAVAATALAATLVLSWILALDVVEWLRKLSGRKAVRYAVYLSTACVLAVISALVVWRTPDSDGRGDAAHLLSFGAIAICGAATGWVAQFADVNRGKPDLLRLRRYAASLLGAEALGLGFSGLILLGFDAGVVSWSQIRTPVIIAAATVAGLMLLIDLGRQLNLLPAIEEDAEPWIDWTDHGPSEDDPDESDESSSAGALAKTASASADQVDGKGGA